MKTFTKLFALLTCVAFIATGCINEDPEYRKDPAPTPGQPGEELKGILSVNNLQMRVILDTQTDTQPDDTGDQTTRPKTRAEVDLSGYTIEIFDAKSASVKKMTYAQMLLTPTIELAVGSYRLEARSADQIPESGWNCPVYIGSKEFVVTKDKITTIDKITCTLANIKVTTLVAADLRAKLTADTKATVTLGTKSQEFSLTEARAAYYMPETELNTLKYRLAGKFIETGSNVELNKTITGVKAGQWRKITLVITYADKGDVKFDIVVDNFTLDDTVIVDGTDGAQWEPELDEVDPSQPTLIWTDNDLSKPFQLTADMFLEDNTCTEPFELMLTSPNGVGSFQVTIASTNSDFMGSLSLVGLPNSFDLCTLDNTDPIGIMLKGFGFPIGDDVKGKKAKTFYIGGELPSMLYGFEGTHSFEFFITDTNSRTVNSTLTLKVDKANEGPAITWEGHDLDQRYPLTAGMAVNLDIAARSGIKSMVVSIVSETLTPLLSDVGMPATFDLCAVEGDLIDQLTGFGFPINDQVKNKTMVEFTISAQLVGMMMMEGLEGDHNFVLDVTDNNNVKTTKTLKLLNAGQK